LPVAAVSKDLAPIGTCLDLDRHGVVIYIVVIYIVVIYIVVIYIVVIYIDEVLIASVGIALPDTRAETLELKGYEFVKKGIRESAA